MGLAPRLVGTSMADEKSVTHPCIAWLQKEHQRPADIATAAAAVRVSTPSFT